MKQLSQGSTQPLAREPPPGFAAGLPCSTTRNHHGLSAFNMTGSLGMEGYFRKCHWTLFWSILATLLCFAISQSYPATCIHLPTRSQIYVGVRVQREPPRASLLPPVIKRTVCIRMAEALGRTAEMNTTLYINYTSIQFNFKRFKLK